MTRRLVQLTKMPWLPRAPRWLFLAFAVVLALAVAGVAGVVGKAARTEAQDTLSGEPSGFIDQERGTYLIVYLDQSEPHAGEFTYAVPGLGLFTGTMPATVEVKSHTSVIVRYDGAGTLDRDAKLDPVLALWTQSSGESEPVSLRLEAHINPERLTTSAQLWYAGQMYKLNSKEIPHNADAALATIADAYNRQDWSTLYHYGYRRLQAGMTEAEFVTWVTSGLQAQGRVVRAQVASDVVYQTSKGGYHVAVGKIALTLSQDGVETTTTMNVVLVMDGGAWRWMTLDAQ